RSDHECPGKHEVQWQSGPREPWQSRDAEDDARSKRIRERQALEDVEDVGERDEPPQRPVRAEEHEPGELQRNDERNGVHEERQPETYEALGEKRDERKSRREPV